MGWGRAPARPRLLLTRLALPATNYRASRSCWWTMARPMTTQRPVWRSSTMTVRPEPPSAHPAASCDPKPRRAAGTTMPRLAHAAAPIGRPACRRRRRKATARQPACAFAAGPPPCRRPTRHAVRTVNSVEAAQACFVGGAVAFDCVLVEHGLLAPLPAEQTAGFFKQAATVHAPVVLMAGPLWAVRLCGFNRMVMQAGSLLGHPVQRSCQLGQPRPNSPTPSHPAAPSSLPEQPPPAAPRCWKACAWEPWTFWSAR